MNAKTDWFVEPAKFEDDQHTFGRTQELLGTRAFMRGFTKAPLPLTDGALIGVQSREEGLRLFVNACPHQARKLIEEPTKSAGPIACKGHGAVFQSNGSLKSFRLFETELPSNISPCNEFRLTEVQYSLWADRLYNMRNLPKGYFDELTELEPLFSLADYRFHSVSETSHGVIRANWKLPLIVYYDVLHVPAIHPALRKLVEFDTLKWRFMSVGNLQTISVKQSMWNEESPLSDGYYNRHDVRGLKAYIEGVRRVLVRRPDLKDHSSLREIQWLSIYPGETHEVYPFVQIITRTIPLSPGSCRQIVEFCVHEAFAEETEGLQGFIDFYNQTANEDNELAGFQQEGYEAMLKYGVKSAGMTHPHFERGTEHFYRFLGYDKQT
jgi:choline monooxygenase